uniref:FBA domain-containing protein n=1 Tax=Neogobius melanostomus TaxID=47308 RepID=A0A8C6UYA9_9GOBI
LFVQLLQKLVCVTEGLQFWELVENGGDGWKVEEIPGGCGHKFAPDICKHFVTSSRLCRKRQVINLLNNGFSAERLDNQPLVKIKDWFSGRTDCGCTYQITVCLLDEKQEVMQRFKPKAITLDPVTNYCAWQPMSHTFSDYGPGLRFISFEHGGRDTKDWKGWYGVRVTSSSVEIY